MAAGRLVETGGNDVAVGKGRSWRGAGGVIAVLKDAFLPEGWPASVSDDYAAYQIWDTLQCFCSSISGQLSTQAVLKGVGVGNETASPLAAALTWTLRDGAGMLGRIVFAWAKASSLDRDPRFWRLVADALNDIAMLIDILSPAFPDLFLLLICLSSVLKAVVGVAGGATRMALTQHQARNYNHADVAAKDGSQETAVNLAALVTGLVLLPAVHGHPMWMWAVFLSVTAGHVYSNYRAVKAVVMETFDEQRIRIVADALAAGGHPTIPTPAEVAARETLYYTPAPIRLGCSIADADVPPDTLAAALAAHGGRRPIYVVVPLRHVHAALLGSHRAVGVILAADATQADVVEACIAGHLAATFMAVGQPVTAAIDAAMRIVGPPHQLAHRLGDAGWRLHTLAYTVGAFRVHVVPSASQPDPVPAHSPKTGRRTPKLRTRASGAK